MTKFEDASDPGFIAIAGELRRWIRGLATQSDTQASSTIVTQQRQEEQQQVGLCM
jgi:hypothetical protein